MRGTSRLRDESLARVLYGKFQIVETTALEFLDERKLVSDISKNLRIIIKAFFIRDCQSGDATLLA